MKIVVIFIKKTLWWYLTPHWRGANGIGGLVPGGQCLPLNMISWNSETNSTSYVHVKFEHTFRFFLTALILAYLENLRYPLFCVQTMPWKLC